MTRDCFTLNGDWLTDRGPPQFSVQARHFVEPEDELAVNLFSADPRARERALQLSSDGALRLRFPRPDELDDIRAEVVEALGAEAPPGRRTLAAAGRIGGPGVRAALESVFKRIRAGGDSVMGASVACAVLRLEPSRMNAAELFAESLARDEPSSAVAVSEFVASYDPSLQLPSIRHCVEAIVRWAGVSDWKRCGTAIAILVHEDSHSGLRRLHAGLRHDDAAVRRCIAHGSGTIRGALVGAVQRILRERIDDEPDAAVAIEILGANPGFATVETVHRILRDGVFHRSPAVRGDALLLASRLDPRVCEPVVQQAMSDEPDPYVRELGQRVLHNPPAWARP